MKEKILEVKDLCFSYDEEHPILHNVNATFYKGEKIAVIGNNGAGKSTFFLNLNGVRIPSSGEIICKNQVINKKNRNELRKTVGIVFQDADMQIIASTVEDEVAFGPLNMKLSKQEVMDRTNKAIEDMELENFRHRPPHYLSGGEKKRVSIAGILAMDTPVVIFDEPTASLDPANVEILENTISEMEKQEKTILISTHDLDFAYRFAERVLVFNDGCIIADGTPEEVFKREEVLKKANLKKPLLLQIYDALEKRKVVYNQGVCPHTIEELIKIL